MDLDDRVGKLEDAEKSQGGCFTSFVIFTVIVLCALNSYIGGLTNRVTTLEQKVIALEEKKVQ